jgi:site-specific DNA-methyltransferase (adenine-specific)
MVKRCSDNHSALFKSATIEWGTPPDLFSALDREFHFNFDACPAGGIWDGTYISWEGKRVFCNPPYGRRIDKWLAKGAEAEIAVFLLPARTDTIWFHEYALKAREIRFFKGRLQFSKGHVAPKTEWLSGAPFPSMLVVYGK